MANGNKADKQGLLEAMLDPVSRAVANAPVDDEPESADERRAVAESKVWFEQHDGREISDEGVLSEFRFTPKDSSKQQDEAWQRLSSPNARGRTSQ
jgi:hypothetical protein